MSVLTEQQAAPSDSAAVTAWLRTALELVPTGSIEQNLFRSILNHNLSTAATLRTNETVTEVVERVGEMMRREWLGFEPQSDHGLGKLEWWSLESPQARRRPFDWTPPPAG